MGLVVNILKISFTRQILTRQLKTRWFSSDCFKKALILGWSKQFVLLEKIDCDSSNRKPDVHTSVRTTPLVMQLIKNQRAHSFVLVFRRTCYLQKVFMLHILDQFFVHSNCICFLLIATASQKISDRAFISLLNLRFSLWQMIPLSYSTYLEKNPYN